MRQHIYEVLGTAGPVEVPEPHAIFRIVKVEEQQKKELYVTVDDYIEDPAVDDFFVVLKRNDDNQWICFYREQFVLAVPVMGKGNFSRFAIPLVKRRYPQL